MNVSSGRGKGRGLSPFIWIPALVLSACAPSGDKPPGVPTPRAAETRVSIHSVEPQTVAVAHQYACRLNSHRNIEIRSPEPGTFGKPQVQTGQEVKQDQLLFRIQRPDGAKKVDADQAGLIVINAPFDGLIGRVLLHGGDQVGKGDVLATLSDNSQIRADFPVPETQYLAYKASNLDQHRDDLKIELVLANGNKFDQPGTLESIGGTFNVETGNVTFRADFPNPDRLLRHGQTGTLTMTQNLKNVLVVPQRATFQLGRKRYMYVVDKDDIARRKEISIQHEIENQFVITEGVHAGDRVVVDGLAAVRDGEAVMATPAPE